VGHPVTSQRWDTEFLENVHQLIRENAAEAEPTAAAERRQHERRAFRHVQLIAPYDGRRLPSQAEFEQLVCEDVSQSGLAFRSRRFPQTKQVIVALGQVPFKFFSAQIVHIAKEHREDGMNYLIGCRFTARLRTHEEQR